MADLCDPLRIAALDDEAGIQTDMPWYYGQFSLTPQAIPFYAFPYKGKWYALTTIATGCRAGPPVSQALTKSLSSAAATPFPGVCDDAYIDNVRFTGNER